MNIPLHRIDPTLPLPAYATAGSVAFDLSARETMTIAPKAIALIPTNLVIATPKGYALIIAARSSLPIKKGLMLANAIGVIDQDYCGPTDEIKVQVYNITEAPVTVERGERIAQGMFIPIERAEWAESAPSATDRGGFGSTKGYTA